MTLALITGANGFVGRHLCDRLSQTAIQMRRCVRVPSRQSAADHDDSVVVGDIDSATDWTAALQQVDVVIHLAARVHVMGEAGPDSQRKFWLTNVDGTMRLARQAAAEGVKRFIYISSVKAMGEQTAPGRPFTAATPADPQDHYGRSKLAAERALLQLGKELAMDIVIIRPPLVYGPGVKANFGHLLRWVRKGYPLPFGAINNRRSFVSVFNLVDLILTCISHPMAANQVFLVSDGESISTRCLIRRIANSAGNNIWMPALPVWAFRLAGRLSGRIGTVERLCGNLEVDINKTTVLLAWTPTFGMKRTLNVIAGD